MTDQLSNKEAAEICSCSCYRMMWALGGGWSVAPGLGSGLKCQTPRKADLLVPNPAKRSECSPAVCRENG